MSQQRLNHCIILYIHKELTDCLSLLECANDLTSFPMKTENKIGKLLRKTCQCITIRNSIGERRLMMSYLNLKGSE